LLSILEHTASPYSVSSIEALEVRLREFFNRRAIVQAEGGITWDEVEELVYGYAQKRMSHGADLPQVWRMLNEVFLLSIGCGSISCEYVRRVTDANRMTLSIPALRSS
jgi:hypothetical protein